MALRKRPVHCVSILLLCSLLLSNASLWPVQAQPPDPQPQATAPVRVETEIAPGLYRLSNGQSIRLESPEVHAAANRTTGGPDDFGYNWDDAAPLNWIDASTGTDTGMSGDSRKQAVGPIPLPFTFKFYEKSYTTLYIAASGYIAFNPATDWPHQFRLPLPIAPNNLIAPYASPLQLANRGPKNRVYYKQGGQAPNRYFVTEWREVLAQPDSGTQGKYTFEVILYENGDITFQYLTMNYAQGGSWCSSAGIENDHGTDGLVTAPFCSRVQSNYAVKFTRPAVSARALFYPHSQGSFTTAANTQRFPISIQNTGELGADTYNLTVASPWQVHLETADGTALTDTNGDAILDTGTIPQGERREFYLRVQTPTIANTADANTVTLSATSQQNPTIQRTATVNLAVPAPFAQVYAGGEYGNDLYLMTAQPTKQNSVDLSLENSANDMSITTLNNKSYCIVWSEGHSSSNNAYAQDLAYALQDQQGNWVRPTTWLTNSSDATHYVYNESPLLATTADGHIGILWKQERAAKDSSTYSYNIFFSILDAGGNVVLPPTNLTNTTDPSSQLGYDSPTLAATTDNRFMLAWYKWANDTANIDLMIYNSTGGVVKPITRFSKDANTHQDHASLPSLATLRNNRALLVYNHFGNVIAAGLTSSGDLVGVPQVVSQNGYRADAVQLANGNLLLAWEDPDYDAGVTRIGYGMVDGNTWQPLGASQTIEPFAGTHNLQNVSVTSTDAGQGIITWAEEAGFYLGYILLDAQGHQITPPTQFATGEFNEATSRPVSVGWYGGGAGDNTPFAATPTSTDKNDLFLQTAAWTGGQPGGQTGLVIDIGNHGLQPATGLHLTATLDPALQFVSAEPPPDVQAAVALQNGGTYTWTLPSINYLGGGQVVIHTTVPSTTIGATYPVTVSLTSANADADPANNLTQTKVMEALQVFLPRIQR